jgi:hypothetical protein
MQRRQQRALRSDRSRPMAIFPPHSCPLRSAAARREQPAWRFSLAAFASSGGNLQHAVPKKMHFPYETAVFSSSIRSASEE